MGQQLSPGRDPAHLRQMVGNVQFSWPSDGRRVPGVLREAAGVLLSDPWRSQVSGLQMSIWLRRRLRAQSKVTDNDAWKELADPWPVKGLET